jgi:hypothetical protein
VSGDPNWPHLPITQDTSETLNRGNVETNWGLDFGLGFGGEISDPLVLEPSDPESQSAASISYGRNLRRSLTLVSVLSRPPAQPVNVSYSYDAVNSVWGTDLEDFQGYVIETGMEYSRAPVFVSGLALAGFFFYRS